MENSFRFASSTSTEISDHQKSHPQPTSRLGRNLGPLPGVMNLASLILSPDKLMEAGAKLDPNLFCFRVLWQDWYILHGKEGASFYFSLDAEEVDALSDRLYILNTILPNVERPPDFPVIAEATRRRLLNKFGRKSLYHVVEIARDQTETFIETHLQPMQGEIKNLWEYLVALCLPISTRCLLGKSIYDELPEAFFTAYTQIAHSLDLTAILAPWLPSRSRYLARSGSHGLVQSLIDTIEKRRKMGEKHVDDPIYDYLHLERENGTGFDYSNEQLVWILNTLQWPSNHYVTVHLFWLLMDILQNPPIHKKIMEEQRCFSHVDGDSVNHMQYLHNCIREGLRLYSVPAIPRQVLCDLEYKHHLIPKGSVLAFSTYLTHRNPEIYPEPNAYRPERWAPGHDHPSVLHFVPGGGGRRGCVGMRLTMKLLTTTAAVLLRNINFSFIDSPPKHRMQTMLMQPKKPVRLRYYKFDKQMERKNHRLPHSTRDNYSKN